MYLNQRLLNFIVGIVCDKQKAQIYGNLCSLLNKLMIIPVVEC